MIQQFPKIANWIDLQVNKSLAILDQAFDSSPLLYHYLISKGKEKMKKSDHQIIEEFEKISRVKKSNILKK